MNLDARGVIMVLQSLEGGLVESQEELEKIKNEIDVALANLATLHNRHVDEITVAKSELEHMRANVGRAIDKMIGLREEVATAIEGPPPEAELPSPVNLEPPKLAAKGSSLLRPVVRRSKPAAPTKPLKPVSDKEKK